MKRVGKIKPIKAGKWKNEWIIQLKSRIRSFSTEYLIGLFCFGLFCCLFRTTWISTNNLIFWCFCLSSSLSLAVTLLLAFILKLILSFNCSRSCISIKDKSWPREKKRIFSRLLLTRINYTHIASETWNDRKKSIKWRKE